MPTVKKIIIVAGMSAVGKSRYCDAWVAAHPEYAIVPCQLTLDDTMADVLTREYVIMDYYFSLDHNANRLRAEAGCPVEIVVLFDYPEAIAYRQINCRNLSAENWVDCYHAYHVYADGGLDDIFDTSACRFIDGVGTEYDHAGFMEKQREYWKPYTREAVENYIREIDAIDQYDKYYHHFNLPHGVRIGKDGYARNEMTWEIIKDWIDWRGLRVLDLCCFHGYFAQQIYFAGGIPVGCDIHNHALYTAAVFAKMNQADYRLYHLDVDDAFPVSKEGYDVALLFNVFHHLKNKDGVLRRMQTIARCLFEINAVDADHIKQYFDVEREAVSPKDGRVILMCKPKAEVDK